MYSSQGLNIRTRHVRADELYCNIAVELLSLIIRTRHVRVNE